MTTKKKEVSLHPHDRQQQLLQWLQSVPPMTDEMVTVTIPITLRRFDWFYLAQGAATNGWTVDQAIGYVLSTREAVLDWHNEDYEARGAVEKVTVEGGDQ